jgi:iron complex outermembrane receptor protein
MNGKHYILCLLLLSAWAARGQLTLSGTITDGKTGASLSGAHLVLENTFMVVTSGAHGEYAISGLKPGLYTLKASFVGYKTERIGFLMKRDTTINISLVGTPILGEEVNILATRAQVNTPATFTNLNQKQIEAVNLGRDMPFILQTSPSTIVTSDADNGIGYTGMNIRGTDLTRINVTVNGIPVNDAESQGVWFVDLPDMASSTDNVQIQRGVGTSTNGAGAFGATVNMQTAALKDEPYGELNLSGGSYNTFKSTLRFGTGLLAGKIAVDGRLSFIRSDGYIDRASSNLKSYFISAGYYGRTTILKLITWSGFEKTYQAWEGVPKDSLSTNRTFNPCGLYYDTVGNIQYYNNQTDNYQQDNYQILFSQTLLKNWNLNLAVHYTKGKGYYESYKQDAEFTDYGLKDVVIGDSTITTTDLINRKMMDNDFCGMTFSTDYNMKDKHNLILGGAWNRYYGRHFGKIIWAEYASNGDNDRNWYYNTGLKKDFNIFIKGNFEVIRNLHLFADIQYRYVDYTMEGTADKPYGRVLDQKHPFNFFNPKAGIHYSFSDHHTAYFSFGIANREPSRNNYKDADSIHIPAPERLYDYELGYSFIIPAFTASVNLYYMYYRDQLVLTGQINNVGEAIMVNVPKSYRTGIELSASVTFLKKLNWSVGATFSRNRIPDFTEYVDNWDTWTQDSAYLGETPLSFSPEILATSALTYTPLNNLSFSLNSRYVGKQYIDNTGNENRVLKGYFINGLTASYSFKLRPFRTIGFNVTINNLFNSKYETNAWVYRYIYQGKEEEYNGYFPQALTNFLVGVSIGI